MAEGFSQQDLQDLDAIARQLPKGDPRAEKIRTAIKAQQAPGTTSVEKPTGGGGLKAFGQDLYNQFVPSSTSDAVNRAVSGAKMFADPAGYGADRASELLQNYGERRKEHGIPYSLDAAAAEGLGANVRGMEQAAQQGDVSGVLGHAAVVPSEMAAGIGLQQFGRPGLAKTARLGARLSNFDLTRPLSLAKPALEYAANKLENVAPTYRDATLNRRNVPEYAGEEETPVPTAAPSVAPRIGGRRMGPPLRPLVGTPEDWQTYDAQKAILRPEASDAGLYSAARGAVRGVPDYQVRIGQKLRPYGPPRDLMEESESPRKKAENE